MLSRLKERYSQMSDSQLVAEGVIITSFVTGIITAATRDTAPAVITGVGVAFGAWFKWVSQHDHLDINPDNSIEFSEEPPQKD